MAKYPHPVMAYDSSFHPGARPHEPGAPVRHGCEIKLSECEHHFVGREASPDTTEAENARRAAIFLATHPGHDYLK